MTLFYFAPWRIETQSQELSPGLPPGWQEPRHLRQLWYGHPQSCPSHWAKHLCTHPAVVIITMHQTTKFDGYFQSFRITRGWQLPYQTVQVWNAVVQTDLSLTWEVWSLSNSRGEDVETDVIPHQNFLPEVRKTPRHPGFKSRQVCLLA